MIKFKKGQVVRKVIPDIIGEVVGAKLDKNMELIYEVSYVDKDNANQVRFFKEDELVAEVEKSEG